MGVRLLVCGGRTYDRPLFAFSVLDRFGLTRADLIVTGGSSGADELAEVWAANHAIPLAVFPAPWRSHPQGAGPLRNTWMLHHGRITHVLAFPGGRGTADTVRKARLKGIPVIEVS